MKISNLAYALALVAIMFGGRVDDGERLKWISIVAKGAERCGELEPVNTDNLLYFIRGIRKMSVATDADIKASKAEFDRIEALARKYEGY